MQKNSIRIVLTTVLLGIFLVGISLWAALKPADAASEAERRTHAQIPASGIITACTGWESIWPSSNTP